MKYQDLMIRDVKFVVSFEKMYQLFDNPWSQTEKGYFEDSVSRNTVVN